MPRRLIFPILLLIAIAAVFGQVLRFDFTTWDDPVHITSNPLFQPKLELGQIWSEPYEGLYIPLAYTIWGWFGHLSHFQSGYFHALNLLVHILCSLVVWGLLMRLIKSPFPALIGALLFALHPLQVEALAWISGFRDLLGALLSLTAIWLLLLYFEKINRPWLLLSLATLAYIGALFSKPLAVVTPLLALLIIIPIINRSNWRRLWPLTIWLLFALPLVFITRSLQTHDDSYVNSPLILRPLIAWDAIAFYLGKLFWPAHFSPDYGRTPDYVFLHGWFWIWLLPAVILVLLKIWRGARQIFPLSVAFAITGLLPVLGLVVFEFQQTSTVADRYMYLSMFAVAWMLAWLINRYDSRLVRIAVTLGICELAILSALQTRNWQNDLTLYQHTLAVNPNSYVAHENIAVLYDNQKQYDLALEHYHKAIKSGPKNYVGYLNLGKFLHRTKMTPDWQAEMNGAFEQALSHMPEGAIRQYPWLIEWAAQNPKIIQLQPQPQP